MLLDSCKGEIPKRYRGEAVCNRLRQNSIPGSTPLYNFAPPKFDNILINPLRGHSDYGAEADEFSVVIVREVFSLKGIHEGAYLRDKVERIVGRVSLGEEPLKQLIVLQPRYCSITLYR